ncbi:penicillin-binding protein 1A [Bradyrhizobium cajani]|uniref:Glycosyl transferase n=1 Tax=Bradyrhizobium cajani TaxID=1928661 RepID=A0A844T478_9BRAD|nr:transglycosylase domain-containing protein [Bradyrhizobium cajani]MCP3371185.1 transglycosylase domain-containing protein [Bradyrhizobium cajani]MVT72435.1 glycosyl transferase [Bradyrhizobium cajani]
MDSILIKIFATALAFSQVATRPDGVKTEFDAVRDRAEVAELLSAGCAHMRNAFDIEDINLDDLITTAMDDKEALSSEIKAFKGLKLADLHVAYRQFCKVEEIEESPVDLGQVITFYNSAVKDLPDAVQLKHLRLPGTSIVLDNKSERLAEIYVPNNRRIWVKLADIPEAVRNAFIAAEDKRFFQHTGIDERGLVRAFIGNFTHPGRPQGGSTITQQVAKNLLVGNDITYERKLREMIVASRMERALTKAEILELYLNSIYLGRGAWGIEMAARSYFGKPAKALSAVEGALLAGLAKGPNYFNPDHHPERAHERLAYVLGRMQKDAMIDAAAAAQPVLPQLVEYRPTRRDFGFHFVDHIAREAKMVAGLDSLINSSYTVRSTVNSALQRAVEATLQEGLARYELNSGRYKFEGPEANISDAVRVIAADPRTTEPAWLVALKATRLPLYDVHWESAVVLENARGKRGDAINVGLTDGSILPLNTWNAAIRHGLKPYDVVYVQVGEARRKQAARAELRIRPTVQGAALVLGNETGRILAMAGGFSYPASQLNRVVQSLRQPGSTLKPLTYLAALQKGLQPNTLVMDEPITLAPIGATGSAGQRGFWSPRNYDGGASGAITLRRALENSRNLATAQLFATGLDDSAEQGLDRVCELAMEAQLYKECMRYYPFVLGAQTVRLIDLAAFYAAIANEGARPQPHAIETIEQDGRAIYRHDPRAVDWIGSADRASFYQLKSLLQGVLARGTAHAVKHLSPYVGGKTGTTDNWADAWFVGFTNDVTVAIWVGYDNGDGGRRTLGRGQTGAKVALPMFEPIMQAAWELHAPRTALNGPSREAMRQLAALSIDPYTGNPAPAGSGRAFTEYLKRDPSGRIDNTQFRIVSRAESYAGPFQQWSDDNDSYGDSRPPFPFPSWRLGPREYPSWRGYPDDEDRLPQPPRRVDPDYFWRRLN